MWSSRWAKKMVSGWLGRILPRAGRSLVLDTAALGTARALRGKARKTTVFGTDKTMPLAAKQMKVKCIKGWSGACLEKARGRFDLIYLDYCGTVDGTWGGSSRSTWTGYLSNRSGKRRRRPC